MAIGLGLGLGFGLELGLGFGTVVSRLRTSIVLVNKLHIS